MVGKPNTFQDDIELLGGSARHDGISFLSRTHITITRNSNGQTITQVSPVRNIRGQWTSFVLDIVRLISAKSSLDHRYLIGTLLSFGSFLFLTSLWNRVYQGPYFYTPLVILLLLLSVIQALLSLDKRKFHAAEHMVVNAWQQGLPLNYANVSRASRVSTHCGTNAVVFIATIFILGFPFFPESDHLWFAFSLIIGTYFFAQGENELTKPLFKFGAFLQERIYTAPPDPEHIEIAIQGATTLLECSSHAETDI